MKAFLIKEPGKTCIEDILEPEPVEGEVVLRVRRVGLCGSDLNSYRGRNPLVQYPRIPGHELSATIVQTSPGVPSEFQPGINVTVYPYTQCGSCPSCRNQRPNACRSNQTLGVQRNGALTEYLAIHWQKLYPSNLLSLEQLALVEPLSVGFHAAARGRVSSGETVLVLGCGAIGLGAIAGVIFRKGSVIAADIDDRKLAIAAKVGAARTINSARESLHQQLLEWTRGDGPDVVIEAIGLPETFRSAVEEVAFTGRVVYIGYAKIPVEYETRLFVQKEIDILGSRNALHDFPDVIAMLENGSFPVNEVVTHTVDLFETGKALSAWDRTPSDVTKILINLDPVDSM